MTDIDITCHIKYSLFDEIAPADEDDDCYICVVGFSLFERSSSWKLDRIIFYFRFGHGEGYRREKKGED